MREKKLYRDIENKMIGGVFSGLEDYTGVDKTVLRLIYAFLSVFSGGFPGITLYIIAAIIIPTKDEVERKAFHDNVKEAEYTEKTESEKSSKSESIFEE